MSKSKRKNYISIKKQLKKEKHKLLSTKKFLNFIYGDIWEQIAKKYKEQEEEPKFLEGINRKEEKNIVEKLKQRTKEVLKMSLTKENKYLYIEAKKWSVVPFQMQEKALNMGFTFLNMEQNSNKDKELWNMRIKDYFVDKKNVNYDFGLLEIKKANLSLEETRNKFKQVARSLMEYMNYDEKSEDAWNILTGWFTKERP